MIRRFKDWLVLIFLPVWTKELAFKQNESLKKENAELKTHIRELNAYIDGLEAGIRAQRRVVINNKVSDR